jgi:hypothetical protein
MIFMLHIKIYCVYTSIYIYCVYTSLSPYVLLDVRVGEGTVPLAIVVYIDGSFVKHKIPVKPIYITVRNLSSVNRGI